MADPTEPVSAPSPVPSAPAPGSGPQLPEQEITAGKTFAILSYVINILGLPFCLVPLITRDNDFSLYHAKQAFVVWLIQLIGYIIGIILLYVCIGAVVLPAVWVLGLVLNIIGLMNAVNGQCKPLVMIGGLAEKWFAGLRKTTT